MEPSTVPTTPGAEPFMEAQCLIANYLSSTVGYDPAHLTDSVELLNGLGDLGGICWSDNVDDYISFLNKELVALGQPALYKENCSGDAKKDFSLLALLDGTCGLLNLYQGASAKLGGMEAQEKRRVGELDYLRTRHGKLKEQVQACEREIAAIQNKEQDLQSKNKQLHALLKEEKDEIARLIGAQASRTAQHHHEMKRKEQELSRLREKASQLLMDKKDKRGTIEVLNALPRPDGKKATCKTGKSLGKKEEELYRVQLAQQEQREQGLVLENTKLRQLLDQVCQDVQQLLGTDIGVAQGTEPSCAYEVLQEQWCRLRNRLEVLSSQAVGAVGSRMLEAYGQNPVISVTDHDKEILKLKEEIEESRLLITLQQQCFQEQLIAATAHAEFPPHLKGSYFLEEQQQLQEEQDLFKEQKEAFDTERRNFTEAAIRLGQERKQFEEEKALFLKQEFLCSLPGWDIQDPKRRLSAPVSVRELKQWTKPPCTSYPKIVIAPCHTPKRLFRNHRQVASQPMLELYEEQAFLPNTWPASPRLARQRKESCHDRACQTETPWKDIQGDLLEDFLDSSF